MHHDVFDAVGRSFEEAFVERDDTFAGLAGAPARFHVPDAKRRLPDSETAEQRGQFAHNCTEYRFALLIQKAADEPSFGGYILCVPDRQIDKSAVRRNGVFRRLRNPKCQRAPQNIEHIAADELFRLRSVPRDFFEPADSFEDKRRFAADKSVYLRNGNMAVRGDRNGAVASDSQIKVFN